MAAALVHRAIGDRLTNIFVNTGMLRKNEFAETLEMLRDRLLDRFSAEDFIAAGREVAAHQRDPYTIINAWITSL